MAVIVQSETPALSKVAHSKSIWNKKSSGTYQPIMSNPAISMLISKQHVIWWVCPICQYSHLTDPCVFLSFISFLLCQYSLSSLLKVLQPWANLVRQCHRGIRDSCCSWNDSYTWSQLVGEHYKTVVPIIWWQGSYKVYGYQITVFIRDW